MSNKRIPETVSSVDRIRPTLHKAVDWFLDGWQFVTDLMGHYKDWKAKADAINKAKEGGASEQEE
jgi:hypothetical protein